MKNFTKEELLERIELLEQENDRLKYHNHYFQSSDQINFRSFEEANQNLHEYFDSANDLIQVISLDKKLLFVNDSWERTLEYSKTQAENLSLDQFIHPNYLELVDQAIEAAQKGIPSSKVEMVFISSKGVKIPVIGSFNSITEEGKIVGYTGIFYNNSVRIKAERAQKLYYQIANLSIEHDKLDKLLEEIHSLLREHIFANNFHVALKADVPNLLTFPYYVDENFGGRVKSYSRSFGKGLSEYTIRNQKPMFLYNEDIVKLIDKGEVELYSDIPKIWLGVPLILDKEVIGVIVVKSHSDPGKYKKQDIELLDFISGQIALVIG
ncbi:GAF domain-containing protein, partial [Cyclobacteriaceae bacterium]|nr:GAF domain-containing protein [Cyclobacteriaceae bacterium]